MKLISAILLVFLVVSCSKQGQPCVDWRVAPDKQALVASFAESTLATIKVTQRTENEDWDDFVLQATYQGKQLYGYWATGTLMNDGQYDRCVCEQDKLENELVKGGKK